VLLSIGLRVLWRPLNLIPTQFVHYIGTWVLHWKIEAMARYLTLGFELELYLPHETCMMYWCVHG
jgi:hypothetical protein